MANISLVAHPAERASRSLRPPLACGCCCCCCCLHTVGGVVGAAIAGRGAAAGSLNEEALLSTGGDPPAAAIAHISSVPGLYWKTMGVLGIIILIAGAKGSGGIALIALGLPLIQLVASAIVALMILNRPRSAWRQLGRVTGFGFLGALLGCGLMALLAGALK